ncbi:hypothetical protein [Intestinimonas butyriciproducens]|uniref:flagellin N-terminal helical domain-containing protein n=1 Tax=Intestinimonas butyriciproducens TaxID=1297617 RepID=UPI00195AC7C4|nr:hypothetical protein [Intestinimonas butyriciproducens]MBM6975754.1 hypothetical protein [Intestinimonas butyriciproducens]
MVRVTTNGSLFNYRYNLSKVTNNLNNSMMKVMTGREFNSYAADPAAATRAFKVHSSLNAINAQYSNNRTVLSKFESAWSNIKGMLDDLSNELGEVPALEGLNATNLSTLDSQAQVLRSGAEAIIQSMNARYDEDFIFAGSDNQEAPFAIDADGFITYRGVQIDNPVTLGSNYLTDPNDPTSTVINPDTKQPYTNNEMLKKWAEDDHLYVDIGLGFELDGNGEVIPSTAFDSAISGIDIMGYGVDGDGDPKNMASLMLRLADVFEGYDLESNTWNNGSYEDANRLVGKFLDSKSAMIDKHAELDAEAKFLNTNSTQLESNFDALNVELEDIERVDQVDAITELVWAQTCYSAALQVGVNVIPQSLIDYMR